MKELFESELFDDINKIFQTIKEKFNNIREPKPSFLLKAFIAFVLCLSALSASMIIIDRAEKQSQETSVEATQEASTSEYEIITMPDNGELYANILFGLDNEENELHLLFVMSLDSSSGQVKIFFLDPSAVCKVNEIEGSLSYHFKNGGVSQLVLAAAAYTDLEIERYLVGDEKAFLNFTRDLGEIEIDVEKSISYTLNGLSYIIDKGVQVMTPDVLLKYMVYLCNNTSAYSENLRMIFAQFAKEIFDCETSQEAQDNFGDVIGYFETNISALDFSENKAAVMKLAREITLKLEAYTSLAEFKGLGTPQQ